MNRRRSRFRFGLFLLSVFAALVLGLLPLPSAVQPLRPLWLALVLIWWVLEAPARVGLGTAFVLGLLADIAFGTLFGEHALRLLMIAFLVQRFRPRLRAMMIGQQALAVFALLLNDRVVALAIGLFIGAPPPHWTFWLSPLLVPLLWPPILLLLEWALLHGRNVR